jgi:hypothetical protein
MSLLALIEQETLAITTTPPQARIASLASNAEAAAAAASSTSLITANNNSAIIIKHYLGDVVYSIADFIDLNRMTLSAATQSLVASSSNTIVKSSLDAVLSQVYTPTPRMCCSLSCAPPSSNCRLQRQLDPLRNAQGAAVSLDGVYITSSVAHHRRHTQSIAAVLRARRLE